MTDQDWITFIEEDHKISTEIWKKHELRFDENFLYIPYFNKNGKYLFDKKRRPPASNENKYLYGSGEMAQLWPYQDLSSHEEWVITEGELDQLTLESHSIVAVTSGGVHSFKRHFADYFKDKKVHICYDNDKSGREGAEDLAKTFLEAGIEVDIIDLPKMESGKDIGDFFRLGHTKEEFEDLIKKARKPTLSEEGGIEYKKPKQKLITEPLSYLEVEKKVLSYLPSSQIGLKIILAVAISAIFPDQLMLWLLLVGVPSSGKTDLVRLVNNSDITYYLDNLTQNAFISGERVTESQKVHDLLPLLNRRCLIIKDWTSIFSLDEKMTKKLLGDLVGIYDKEFTKFSSRRGIIRYKSTFSQLGCITPATLNRHTNYMNMVGPRFLCYSMPPTTREEKDKSFELIFSDIDRSIVEAEARLYVSSYLNQLTQKNPELKPLSKNVQKYLRIAAELMSNCRGIVIMQASSFKNEDEKSITYYDISDIQIEDPWRAVQQLKVLAGYLAFVVGKDEVGTDELAIIKEIVISSMPADRSQALRLVKKYSGTVTAKVLSDSSEKSNKTSRRLLDELTALRVLEKIKGSGTIANDYSVHQDFREFILLDPAEFLSSNASGTETRDSIEEEIKTELLNLPSTESENRLFNSAEN